MIGRVDCHQKVGRGSCACCVNEWMGHLFLQLNAKKYFNTIKKNHYYDY